MEKDLCGIYCWTNLINQKRYIGQSVNIRDRQYQHLTKLRHNEHLNEHLQASWNKYGEDNFEFTILELCDFDLLDDREKYYIQLYQTTNNQYGYNSTCGGQNGASIRTEEACKRNSEAQKKYIAEHPEARERLSEISKRTWANEEYRKSRSGENHPMFGKHHSEETKRKLSKANKGKDRPRSKKEKPVKLTFGNNPLIKCIETEQIFKTSTEAANALGIHTPGHIRAVCHGNRKSCGGYHFEFYYGDNNS